MLALVVLEVVQLWHGQLLVGVGVKVGKHPPHLGLAGVGEPGRGLDQLASLARVAVLLGVGHQHAEPVEQTVAHRFQG